MDGSLLIKSRVDTEQWFHPPPSQETLIREPLFLTHQWHIAACSHVVRTDTAWGHQSKTGISFNSPNLKVRLNRPDLFTRVHTFMFRAEPRHPPIHDRCNLAGFVLSKLCKARDSLSWAAREGAGVSGHLVTS